MNLQAGDIGFVYNGKGNWFSKTVAWFMKSQWSHSFIVLGKIHGVVMVLETSDFEITINRMSRYQDGRPLKIYRRSNELNDAEKYILLTSTFPLLGKIYGYRKFLFMGLRRLLMRLKMLVKMRFNNDMVCCDVVMHAYKYVESSIKEVKDIDTEELFQIVSNSKDFKEVPQDGRKY